MVTVALTFFLAGCGSQAATATGCAASAVQAISAHGALADVPGACRPLGPDALSQAIRIVVSQLSGLGDKAEQRHLAGRARARMTVLIDAAAAKLAARQRADARRAMAIRHRAEARCDRPTRCGARAAVRSSGIRVPAGLAALAAWLLTAASGGVLLGKWLAHRRPMSRSGPASRPPAVVLTHLGLAMGGLGSWVGYLLTRWPPLAWTGLSILLPVAGLGMATLVHAIPDPDRARRLQSGTAGAPTTRKAPVVMIVAHGVLATATLLLALLGSVAALGSR